MQLNPFTIQRLLTRVRNVKCLEQRILEALVPQAHQQFFLPNDSFDSIVTQEAIGKELGMIAGLSAQKVLLYASEIYHDSRKIFAILVYLGRGHDILNFLYERITDDDLPLKSPGSTIEARGSLPKALRNWPQRELQDFSRVQWYFLAPVFFTAHGYYELDECAIMPFVEDNENAHVRRGGYGEVWSVRIHPAHQNFYKQTVCYPCPRRTKQYANKR